MREVKFNFKIEILTNSELKVCSHIKSSSVQARFPKF